MSDTERQIHCGQCDQDVIGLVRATYQQDIYEDMDGTPIETWMRWYLLQCGACQKMTLQQVYSEDDWHDARYDPTIYPKPSFEARYLPEVIRANYLEARKVRSLSPGACVVMAGRTLEAVCEHEGTAGRNLAERLHQLQEGNRIPPMPADMARQLRIIRNIGAHNINTGDVTREDAAVVMEFLEAILEYLYVAPAKVAMVERRINRATSP